jgi:phosphatidylinositol kinase/protein kinase (PI-3  family)
VHSTNAIARDKIRFVFTPEMAYVMGGSSYRKSSHFKKFLDFCAKAFLTLRKNANLLENLFGLMVAAGMPELIKESDIYYMRDKLLLNEKAAIAKVEPNFDGDETFRTLASDPFCS